MRKRVNFHLHKSVCHSLCLLLFHYPSPPPLSLINFHEEQSVIYYFSILEENLIRAYT